MRKLLLTLICVAALAALVGCGGDSNHNNTQAPSNPSGGNNAGFSNSSLSGTYVFTSDGYNSDRGYSYAVAGVFTADGSGNVTGGMRDTVRDNGSQTLNESISGTYYVNQDGRGQLRLNRDESIYRFVMESHSVAKLFEISDTSDATGKIQLQSNLATTFAGTSPFIFTLNGDNVQNKNLLPYGAVGGLTFTAAGGITGAVDENNAGVINDGSGAATSLSVSSGNYTLGSSGRGTMSFTTPAGTHNFIVYEVSPSRLEVISTDTQFWLYGYASIQNNASANLVAFSGSQTYSLSGEDSNGYPIVEAGRLTLDGAGNITSGLDDVNDDGSITSALNFTGTYALGNNGRWTASVATTANSLIGWQVSATESALLTSNNAILQTGIMRAQTSALTNASITGNFAQELDGLNLNAGNVEINANYLADGNGNLTGTFDSQTPSGDYTDNPSSGSYAIQATGRGTGTVDGVTVVMYASDANTIYLVSSDSTRVYSGKMVKQQ